MLCIIYLNVSEMFFSMYFYLTNQFACTVDAWHVSASPYDETTKKLLISSYELVNIRKRSTTDFTLQRKKRISSVLMF